MASDKIDLDSASAENVEALEETQGSILMGLIKQLRVGMDLSRVTLPTFILEPRSFLERMSDFMLQGDLLIQANRIQDPLERAVQVVKWYLGGWHIKPRGVKKPYNPILGEVFFANWQHERNGKTTMIGEQVSHHPPVSAIYFENLQAGVILNGHIYTRSKFLGNSAACVMEGEFQLYLKRNGQLEEYIVTLPTVYVRGVIFGTLLMEIGGKVSLECKSTEVCADIEFKTKPFFGGSYNDVKGTISHKGKAQYQIAGKWDGVMTIQNQSDKSSLRPLYEVSTAQYEKMYVAPLEEQGEWESRRMWDNVTKALLKRDHDTTTKFKSELEDAQRARAKEHVQRGTTHETKFFVLNEKKQWRYNKIQEAFDTAASADIE